MAAADWIKNPKFFAKFVETKPVENIMEWPRVTDAEVFSSAVFGGWPQCKYYKNRLKHNYLF